MKKYILIVFIVLTGALGIYAQQSNNIDYTALQLPIGNTDVAPVPFHQYLQQHKSDFQRGGGVFRNIVYKEIGYRHDVSPAATWLPTDSGLFTYNAQAKLIEADSVVNPTHYGPWVDQSKVQYTYDANNNPLTWALQYYNTGSSAFVNSKRYGRTYNSSNYLVSDTEQIWSDGNWLNQTLTSNTYDGNNNLTQQINAVWDTIGNAWLNSTKSVRTYDVSNSLMNSITETWIGGNWSNTYQYIFTRDANHNVLTETVQNYPTNAWVNWYLYTSTYDGQANRVSFNEQSWNTGSSSWMNVYQEAYSYDANHNMLTQIESQWNSGSSTYVNTIKHTYTYNGANKELSNIYQTWNAGSSIFVNANEYLYYYDANNNDTLEEPFNWINNAWSPTTALHYSYDLSNNVIYELSQQYEVNQYVGVDQFFFYYQSFSVSDVDKEKNELHATLYPNPGSGNDIYVKLDLEEPATLNLRTYDTEGRIISIENHPATSGANTILNLTQAV